MLPTCPHCQKNIPVVALMNARNLKQCPSCQATVTPKINWGKGVGLAAVVLVALAALAILIFGKGMMTTLLPAIGAFVAFTVFGYRFEKKD